LSAGIGYDCATGTRGGKRQGVGAGGSRPGLGYPGPAGLPLAARMAYYAATQ